MLSKALRALDVFEDLVGSLWLAYVDTLPPTWLDSPRECSRYTDELREVATKLMDNIVSIIAIRTRLKCDVLETLEEEVEI